MWECRSGTANARVTAKFVENETAHQGTVLRWHELMRAEEMRKGAAAVDVADDEGRG